MVGIIPVFISMTNYQTAAARNKTTLQPTCLWPLSCGFPFFSARRLQLFRISIYSFRIAGYPVVTIAMSMIKCKLGEDKQNKQKKNQKPRYVKALVRWGHCVAVDGGARAISLTIVWGNDALSQH
ncbi:MarC family protein [Shigella flexneri]